MLIALTFVLVLILETARRQRKEVLVQDYTYRLFALRDELRECAIKEDTVAKNWVFQYLDSTIARSIKLMPRFSIWFVLGLLIAYRKNSRLEKLRTQLRNECEKPKNLELKRIEASLTAILGEYIVKRHILLLFISVIVVFLPVKLAQTITQLKKRSLELMVESPETSTLGNFAPQPLGA